MEKADKMVLSILHKDFSLFPKKTKDSELMENTVRLYYQSKEEESQLVTYKNLYENILDKLEIGIMILHKTNNFQDWQVFYANPEILQILDVPKYNDWRFYENKIPDFYHLIEQKIGTDTQEFLDVSIANGANSTYSLRTSNLKTPEQNFCIITLESVQSIIERKEKLAWNNLMKVISHELLNTLTPINGLIDNLEYISKQDEINKEDQEEMRQSLQIINSKSHQLLTFIDSYRQVAELPKPQIQTISIKTILENVLNLMQPEFDKNKIQIQSKIDEISLQADKKMIERVFINILTNAIYAFENQENKTIEIQTILKPKRFIIQFKDNGSGIDNKIKNKIFMPFFTTRKNGSGIGLTLAKSIMEAHKGYISFSSDEDGSMFEVVFVR